MFTDNIINFNYVIPNSIQILMLLPIYELNLINFYNQ